MIDGKSVLTLVMARGGSKGLPGKNIRPLLKKPLIGWTVEAACGSQYVDRVIASSDSQEILAAAHEFGAETPFVRPAELATDNAKQEDAILHAMSWVEKHDKAYDLLLVLAPTSPLRDAEEVDAAITFLARHPKARAIASVVPCIHNPLLANILPEDLCMQNFISEDFKTKNRQELPVYHQLSGSIFAIYWDYFREQQTFLTPKTYAYMATANKGLDINVLDDFLLAEVYLSHPELR